MFYQNWKLAIFAIFMIPLAAGLAKNLGKKIGKVQNEAGEIAGTLTSFLSDIFRGSRMIRIYQKEDIENENAITLNHNGVEREYLLHVPEIYTGSVPVPVVMNFHGGGGTATGQMYLADMRPIADTANFILVYPQGLQLDNGGSTHWNSMLLSDSNKSTVDDFGFIDALINELSLTYNIDTKRL